MSDQYLGEIRMFTGDYAPVGWALCNGQTLTVKDNEALFSLLGTTYGGDGETTFGLPDLQCRIPIHIGTDAVSGTTYALGDKGGTETVTLTAEQLPAHTHAVNVSGLSGTLPGPANAFWAAAPLNVYSNAAPNGAMSNLAIGPAGGNQSHNNVAPFFVVNFIIAVQGNYPSPN